MKYSLYILKIAFLLALYMGFYYLIAIADEGSSHPAYVINPGDQLLITVFGHETELTALVVVRSDGMISYPVVGEIEASGLTIPQLTDAIKGKLELQGFYKEPQVTVQLKESFLGLVYVFGAVMEPGQKKFPRPASVIEVLAAAGRPEDAADLSKARIIKKGNEVIPVDLAGLLESNLTDQSIAGSGLMDDKFIMEDGDVLIIPYAAQIDVIGSVNKPGRYYVRSDISPIQALALAGGFLETADLKHVRIIGSDGVVNIVDATSAWSSSEEAVSSHSLMVRPGDSVVVSEKTDVKILGAVKNQGLYPVDGEISLIDALALAGVDKDSNLKNLRIIRSNGEKITVDVSESWRHGEQFTKEKLNPGDTLIVPSSFKINWTAISVSAAIFSTVFALLSR